MVVPWSIMHRKGDRHVAHHPARIAVHSCSIFESKIDLEYLRDKHIEDLALEDVIQYIDRTVEGRLIDGNLVDIIVN